MTLRTGSIEPATSSAGTQLLRALLRRVDVDRPKRIDGYIDYFGKGRATEGALRGATRWGERDQRGGDGLSRRRRP
jgi:hypothetical protein